MIISSHIINLSKRHVNILRKVDKLKKTRRKKHAKSRGVQSEIKTITNDGWNVNFGNEHMNEMKSLS